MTSYIISFIVAAAFLLIAALISSAIKFEGGSNPTDPKKRKLWFWVMAVINPILFFLLGAFVLAPKADDDQMVHDAYMAALPIATAVGFVVYILIGFVMAKMFKNGKIGHWF
jgi:sulfoxide reductase heme-binding subunit YedZ